MSELKLQPSEEKRGGIAPARLTVFEFRFSPLVKRGLRQIKDQHFGVLHAG